MNRFSNIENSAFLLSVPLSYQKFKTKWEGGNSDFLISQLQVELTTEQGWSVYSKAAEKTNLLIDKISELGVSIIREANVNDFVHAVSKFDVVVLLAHNCSLDIEKHHILDSQLARNRLIEYIHGSINNIFSESDHQLVINSTIKNLIDTESKLQKLCDSDFVYCLNVIMNDTTESLQTTRNLSASGQLIKVEGRYVLEKILDSALLKSNRVEFFDRLCSPTNIPFPEYTQSSKLVDLLVCNSYPFAYFLKNNWGQKITFICGNHPVSMFARVAVAYQTFKLMKQHELSYQNIAKQLRMSIAKR